MMEAGTYEPPPYFFHKTLIPKIVVLENYELY